MTGFGLKRSEQLRDEWDKLRDELCAMDSNNETRETIRRQVIQTRMDQIVEEITKLVSHTRRPIPTPDIDVDEDDDEGNDGSSSQASLRRQQLSPQSQSPTTDNLNGTLPQMRTERTYHSTSSSGEDDSEIDIAALRREMMLGAPSNCTTVTVEPKPSYTNQFRSLTRGIANRLRSHPNSHSSTSSPKLQSSCPPPIQHAADSQSWSNSPARVSISPEDNSNVSQSTSVNNGDDVDQVSQASSAANLDKLAAISITGEHEDENGKDKLEYDDLGDLSVPVDRDGKIAGVCIERRRDSNVALSKCSPSKGHAKTVLDDVCDQRHVHGHAQGDLNGQSKVGWGPQDEADFGMESTKTEQISTEARAKEVNYHKTGEKRKGKSRWKAIEASIEPLKAFGKSVWNSSVSSSSPSRNTLCETRSHANSNAFADLHARVEQRGEHLAQTAHASERMANDASDMLAAARALRQRQQKS